MEDREVNKMEWEIVPIVKMCKSIVSGGTPSTKNADYYLDGTIPWLKTKEVQNRRVYKTETYITQSAIDNSSAKMIPENSVIIAMYGDGNTAGKVAINKIPLSTNQACCNLIFDDQQVNNEFVFYNLLGRYREIVNLKTGSGQQNLNLAIIKNMQIALPDIDTQRNIAYILSSLDIKSEKNNEYISVLDVVIQTLYQSWFSDFCYPDAVGEMANGIPIDWKNSNVFDNVTEVRDKNKDNADYPVLSVVKDGEFKPSDDVFTKQVYSKSTTNYKIVRHNQVGYNPARANIGSIAMLTDFDAGLVSPIYIVFEMNETITPTFFYYYMKQPMFVEAIKHHAIGTTRQNFPFEAFKMFPMVVPPLELQEQFEEIAKPIEQKIAKLKEENIVLAEIRDTLLPKLMSGELAVEVGED